MKERSAMTYAEMMKLQQALAQKEQVPCPQCKTGFLIGALHLDAKYPHGYAECSNPQCNFMFVLN